MPGFGPRVARWSPAVLGLSVTLLLPASSVFAPEHGIQAHAPFQTVASRLHDPTGLARDPTTGDLFIAEAATGVILRLDPQGYLHTHATDFARPRGLAWDSHDDSLLVVDEKAGTLSRIARNGVITVVRDDLKRPHWVAVGKDGNLYVTAEQGAGSKLSTRDGGILLQLALDGSHPQLLARGFKLPAGLRLLPDGRVRFLTHGLTSEPGRDSGILLEFTPGEGLAVMMRSGFEGPHDLSLDALDATYLTADMQKGDGHPEKGVIGKVFSGEGVALFAMGLQQPQGLVFDQAGNLHVAETGAGRVLKFLAPAPATVEPPPPPFTREPTLTLTGMAEPNSVLTVRGAAVPFPPLTDVSGQVVFQRSGSWYDGRSGLFLETVTLTKTGSTPLAGPLAVVLTEITPPEVTLANATGTTPDGHPFVEVPLIGGLLRPDERIRTVLKFRRPHHSYHFAYTHQLWALRPPAVAGADGRFMIPLMLNPNTEHHLEVFATAAFGLGLTSPPGYVTITHDDTSPALTVMAPPDGAVVATPSLIVRGTVQDANLEGVTVNGQRAEVADGHFQATVPLPADGTHPLTVTARDRAGNTTTTTRTVTRDTIPPTVTITGLPPGMITEQVTITVQGRVGDATLDRVIVNGILATVTGTTYQAAGVPLAEGPNVLMVTALDRAGNTASTRVTVLRDTAPPTLTFANPTPGAILIGAVPVEAQASDAGTGVVSVTMTSPSGLQDADPAADRFQASWETTALPDGPFTLRAEARDAAGHVTTVSVDVLIANLGHFAPAPPLPAPRAAHTATLLPDGRHYLFGGRDGSGSPQGTALGLDPGPGQYKELPLAPTPRARQQHAATLLPSGQVLVLGGQGLDGQGVPETLTSAELHDPGTGAVTPLAASLLTPRRAHTATLLTSGEVLVAGGEGADGAPLASLEVFDPQTAAFRAHPAALTVPRSGHTATLLPDGRVLLLGGRTTDGALLATAETFDPAQATFTLVSGLQLPEGRGDHTATLLPNGELLVAGGRTAAGPAASALLLGVLPPGVRPLAPLAGPRADHAATLLPSGRVLLLGGEVNPVLESAEEFLPAAVDTVAPTVAEVRPPAGTTDVSPEARVAARFSEPIDPTTLSADSFRLIDQSTNRPIDGALAIGEGGLLAFLTPASPLTPGATYAAHLAADILDTSGNPLVPFTSSFTVQGGGPLTLTLDPPTLTVGQTGSVRAQLPAPAPLGGVTVVLESGNTNVATLAVRSLTIPAGQQTGTAQVSAVGAGTANLTASAPGYTPASATLTVRSLRVTLTQPADGVTVAAGPLLVRGTIETGGAEVGVTVNGISAAVQGTTFAALVPVTPDTTSLTAVATTISGATASYMIALTVTPTIAPAIVLEAFPAGGAAPLTVTFHLRNNTGRPLVLFELDTDGDGSIDFTASTFDEPWATYTRQGLVFPTIRVTDDQGKSYTGTAVITVGGMPPLEAKWEGMKNALRRGDLPAALSFIHTESRAHYEAVFQRLTPTQLAAIDQYLTTALPVEIGPNGAEYEMRRARGSEILSFPIWFQVDTDGIWRLRMF